MLDLSPRRFVNEFSRGVRDARDAESRLKLGRHLLVSSCVVAMEERAPQTTALDVYEEALADQGLAIEPKPTLQVWRNTIRVVAANIGPDPLPTPAGEVLLGLQFGLLDYEDMSRARHPTARSV